MSGAMIEARRLLAQALELDEVGIADDALLETLEGWDSIVHLRLVIAIETAIGAELPTEEILEIKALEDVARLLDGQ